MRESVGKPLPPPPRVSQTDIEHILVVEDIRHLLE